MSPHSNPENANCTILVVDDHAFNLEVMEGLLYGEGYKVLTASGGNEALKIASGESVDLAILDVMMPGMNGFELCKKLKAMFGQIFFPIILVTALAELEDKIAGLNAGADDFLTKPFHTGELLTKIGSLLKLRKLHNALELSEGIIMAMTTLFEAKHPYTRGHSERVGNLAMELASYIGMPQSGELLFKAGVLHDVGKIGIREEILVKTESLTEEEIMLLREHTHIGEDICRPLFSARHVLPAIRSHHERWDGQGFPDGLKGEDIPLFARVIAVANSFDAMVSPRFDRPHVSGGEAVLMMEQDCFSGQWDPGLLDSFIRMMKERGCVQ